MQRRTSSGSAASATRRKSRVRGGDSQDAHRTADGRDRLAGRRSGRRAPGGRHASTDLADVSWNVPTVSMTDGDLRAGRAGAQLAGHGLRRRHAIGVKGMMVAAKTMALTADRSLHRLHRTFRRRAQSSIRSAGRISSTKRGSRTGSRRWITGSDDGITNARQRGEPRSKSATSTVALPSSFSRLPRFP